MKYPLLPVTLLLAAGIIAGDQLHPQPFVLLGAAIAIVLAALAANFLNKDKSALPLIGAALFMTGWADIACHTAILSPNDLRLLLPRSPSSVTIQGTVSAPPSQRIYERDGREIWHNTTVVESRQITIDGVPRAAVGKVVVATPGILPANFFVGQKVEVSGVIEPPHEAQAQGLFSPHLFYQRQEIYFALRAGSTNDWHAFSEAGVQNLTGKFTAWAKQTLALGLPVEDEALRLIWALVLDWKPGLTPAVEEPFIRAGTFHIFAVDGLRIGMLAAIALAFLRSLQAPRAWAGAVVLPAIWWYVGLTGSPASAIRSAIMTSVIVIGWAARRPANLINSLFAGALLILAWNPQQLFQAGFQLSFIVVLCIGLLLPAFEKVTGSRTQSLVPKALEPQWVGWWREVRGLALATLSLSLAAWLGSIPLSAAYFHLFSLASVPANFLVVPLASLALTSGLASLLVAPLFPGLSVLFNHSGWFWMKCVIALSQWFAQLPGSWWNAAAPRPLALLCYYLLLLTLATGWLFRFRFRRQATAVLTLLCLLCVADWMFQRGETRLHVLSLRGAAAIFVPSHSGSSEELFDCGDPISAQAVVKPFLQAQGVNRLESFCLTDARSEIMGGAPVVLTNFSPSAVFAGSPRARSVVYRRFLAQLSQRVINLTNLTDGNSLNDWTVEHPSADDQFSQADDNAVALSARTAGQSILFLSSLGRSGQDALVKRHPDLRADIVIAGLPVRDEPLSEPLLDLLDPKTIIVADSETPASRRAPQKLQERLARRNARVFYCHYFGSLTLVFRATGWRIEDVNGNEVRATAARSEAPARESNPPPDDR
jgi:ComEC/Rec2-related protein